MGKVIIVHFYSFFLSGFVFVLFYFDCLYRGCPQCALLPAAIAEISVVNPAGAQWRIASAHLAITVSSAGSVRASNVSKVSNYATV